MGPTWTKAAVALVGAVGTWGVTAAEDERYSQGELWGLLLAVATAFGVYAARNGAEADPSTSTPEPDRGAVDVGGALGIAVLVLLILVLLRVLGLL